MRVHTAAMRIEAENIDARLTESAALGDLLRLRPLGILVLEKWDLDPWPRMESSLASACAESGLPADRIASEIAGLAIPPRGSDWDRLPCAYLLDFLTEDHRLFLRADFPAILRMLDLAEESGAGSWGSRWQGRRRMREFASLLADHIAEEESAVFPGILEGEYRLRHPDRESRFDPARDFAQPLRYAEEGITPAVGQWSRELTVLASPPGSPPALVSLNALIRELETGIRAHARLESRYLYPRALSIRDALIAMPSRPRRK